MKFKKNDKVNGGMRGEFTVYDTIEVTPGAAYYILTDGDGTPVVYAANYVERFYTLASAPMPGEFYVSSGGSVFMVDNERSIWLVSDRFDGRHKSATNSHQGRWSYTLTYWEKSMDFGPLKKIDIPKFDIKSL